MKLLTVLQYARLKGISSQAVYQKISNNKLKTVIQKVDALRIPVEDIEEENDK